MEIGKHFGVYGVCIKNGRVLCIKKNAGPYQGRFDLPGGSQEKNEGLTETLHREVREETGFSVQKYTNNRIYDTFVTPKDDLKTVHHIFALYDIDLNTKIQDDLPLNVEDGKNDSDGAVFVDINELNTHNSSPLVLKMLEELKVKEGYLDKSIFLDWDVKNFNSFD